MNIQFVFTSLLALALSGSGGADWIKSQETEVSAMEGKSVNLLCNYGTSSRGVVDLYWFRQYPNQALEFILYRGWGYSGKGDADFTTEKFYSKSTANATTLYIGKLKFADTARYHCALRKPRWELCIEQLYKNTSAWEEGECGTSITRTFVLVCLRDAAQY